MQNLDPLVSCRILCLSLILIWLMNSGFPSSGALIWSGNWGGMRLCPQCSPAIPPLRPKTAQLCQGLVCWRECSTDCARCWSLSSNLRCSFIGKTCQEANRGIYNVFFTQSAARAGTWRKHSCLAAGKAAIILEHSQVTSSNLIPKNKIVEHLQ